jgi:hypothetical protein
VSAGQRMYPAHMTHRQLVATLAVAAVLVAVCVAGWLSNATVTVQFGCETVEGHKLCGEQLKAVKDLRESVQALD